MLIVSIPNQPQPTSCYKEVRSLFYYSLNMKDMVSHKLVVIQMHLKKRKDKHYISTLKQDLKNPVGTF